MQDLAIRQFLYSPYTFFDFLFSADFSLLAVVWADEFSLKKYKKKLLGKLKNFE